MALSAAWREMAPTDSMEAPVWVRVAACCEAPAATAWLTVAICWAAEETWATAEATWAMASWSAWPVALSASCMRACSPA